MVFSKIDFPRTHDIGALVALMPLPVAINLSDAEARHLSTYATVTRYPGDYDPVSLEEARRAVRLARRVRKQTRELLPADGIRRRR